MGWLFEVTNASMNTSFDQDPSTVDPASEIVQRLQRRIEQLEQCLLTRDARNRQLMAAMPQIAWIAKADGSITDFNYRWYEYTGLAPAESLYWGFLQAIHPEERDRVVDTWQYALQHHCYESQCRLLGIDGIYRWFKGEAKPLIGAEGEILEWVGTYSHIEPSPSQAADLEKEPEFLQALFANLSDGIVACDANGVITLFNRASQDFHGLPAEPIPVEAWASHYDLYLHDGSTLMGKEEIPLFRALKGETVRNVEMMIVPKQGKARTLLAAGNAIVNATGQKLGAVVVMRDITERKQAEAALKESEERLERILETIPNGITIINAQGQITFANVAAENILGLVQSNITSRIYNDPAWKITTIEGEPFPKAALPFVQVMQTGKPVYDVKHAIESDERTRTILSINAAPLVNASGEIVSVITAFSDITESYQVQEMLHLREQEFKALVDNAPDVILRCDRSLRYVYANPVVERTTGIPAAAFVGKSFAELGAPPQLCELWENTLRQVFATSQEQAVEFESFTLDGIRTYQSRVVPELNQEGMVQYALVVSRDITELKQAEAEIRTLNAELEKRVMERTAQLAAANQLKDELLIREQAARSQAETAEGRYRDLMNGLVDVIVWESDSLTVGFTFVSQSAERLLGYPVEQWLTKPNFWTNLIHPSDREWAIAFCQEETRQRRDHEFEYRCIAADGRVVWLRDRAYIVQDADGNVEKIRGLMLDVTQRKQAESEREQALIALQESEERFRSMADKAPVMIWVSDDQANYIFLNQFWLNFTGCPMETQLGQGWQQGVHPDDLPQCIEISQAAFSHREEFKQEYRLRRADGQYRWILETGIPRLTPDHEFAGYIGSCIDISERKLAEEALRARADELARMAAVLAETNAVLEKRNQELDQFAYVTSHDLKAPLRAIANLSHWIEEDIQAQLTDETRHQMALLRGRVHRMEALINALLQYSRAGRMNQKPELVKVDSLLSEVIDSLAPPPEFKVIVAPGMPTLITELLPLQQVFTNLMGNAIKHHHRRDGQVKISVLDQGDAYEFSVADDGPGIAPEYHGKIFVIFQTLQARDKVENTGVGLALVKKIVESKGGNIQLESTEGQGSTFRFTWPKKKGNR